MLRISGAELVEVPAVPYRNPNNYVKYSQRLAKELGAVWANQFDNVANRTAHYETTGPEIFAQTKGKIDAFSCAVGTGGTLAGTAMYLREQNPNVKIALTDPKGAALYRFYTTGELSSAGSSITEGIGQGRVTKNLEGFKPDLCFEIDDKEGLPWVYQLLQEEGLCLGLSSAINVAGAIEVAKELGPGHTIVTILCDLATRYTNKMFDLEFLRSKDLPGPEWMSKPITDDIAQAAARATASDEEVAIAMGKK
mmetsp:Transcript_7989/g.14492  ORF Transcript_7989/g.14492 Transcript_7989/m.14492 type:complete len:252 (+) Transcript_7989:460-1215(+)